MDDMRSCYPQVSFKFISLHRQTYKNKERNVHEGSDSYRISLVIFNIRIGILRYFYRQVQFQDRRNNPEN